MGESVMRKSFFALVAAALFVVTLGPTLHGEVAIASTPTPPCR